ncbi:MAG: radical SAM protein [Clostridiales bacterium]|nr:radical SAM protein [Clostridiales bacterium]
MMKKFYVQWHLLDRCQLRCQHCYQEDFSAKGELSWDELLIVAQNLLATMEKWAAKLEVALTGGEPFLQKELPELLAMLNSSPQVAEISIITNGLIFPSWTKDLKSRSKFKGFKISVDGTAARTNDLIRGEGAFLKVMEGMKKLKSLGLPFIIIFTAMKRNWQEAAQLFELAKETGAAGFIIERFIPLGQGKDKTSEVLSGEEFWLLWQQILSRCGLEAEPEELIPYRAIKVEIGRGGRYRVYGSECIVPQDGMALMPDGTVFPCRRFPVPIGNLLQTSLDEIWQTLALLKDLRNKEKFEGRCRLCPVSNCFGCRAMAYALTGNPLTADPHCWLSPIS